MEDRDITGQMVDLHTHILPNMDDGSSNVEESKSMLAELSRQGVGLVCATPHFYPKYDSMDSFLRHRDIAITKLRTGGETMIPIRLGAEVLYFDGIGCVDMRPFCIEGTKLLLLELPDSGVSEDVIRNIVQLMDTYEIQVVLAHMERYIDRYGKMIVRMVREFGVLTQSNASFFHGWFHGRHARRLVSDDMIHFIASDCHNMTSRPPLLSFAYESLDEQGQAKLDYHVRQYFEKDGGSHAIQ